MTRWNKLDKISIHEGYLTPVQELPTKEFLLSPLGSSRAPATR
jgi:hypothetical protein